MSTLLIQGSFGIDIVLLKTESKERAYVCCTYVIQLEDTRLITLNTEHELNGGRFLSCALHSPRFQKRLFHGENILHAQSICSNS